MYANVQANNPPYGKKRNAKHFTLSTYMWQKNIFFNQSPFKVKRKCTKHVSKFLKSFKPSEISNLVKNVPIYS